MTKRLNRRQFFKKSLITSAAVTSASGFSRTAPSAATAKDTTVPDRKFPAGRIGNVQISRLIIGGNQFSGWSHSRDLSYLRDLFLAYSSEKKIMETLEKCEEEGVDTIITASSGYLPSKDERLDKQYKASH
jgi:hypothetical protein